MPPMPERSAPARASAAGARSASLMDLVAGDDVEGQRQQAVAGEDRGGVVGLSCAGWDGRGAGRVLSIAGRSSWISE